MSSTFAIPAHTKFTVVESTETTIEVQSPVRLWWPGPFLCAAAVFGGVWAAYQLWRGEYPRDTCLDGIAVCIVLLGIFALITAVMATHKWLRVADGWLHCQWRFLRWPLNDKRVRLVEPIIFDVLLPGEDSSETVLSITAPSWSFAFGEERAPEALEALRAEIERLQRQ